ncbi:LLM class flavin-dependent oxidoreductase [Streptomyces sp. NY05-11A]|uniref:LLM class flavin-dependent oxidoreductase n=1 Tax=Streptomyces soliscabiei TaxID=588897 RepID=UPI0029A4B4DB|nr:LLM class flavin-dependent oxidoreductase [Streptomyces sp. NY05-11A]MDX2680597.1 LLM class flavin-dependent oxidoreductase [Streptomyces sp. NY05-11A]
MHVGLNFLPTAAPDRTPAAGLYAEWLELCAEADLLGFAHVKVVEHHLHPWGGYSPDPVALLSAVAARTRTVRLVTGAVVPAFTHPVKLAASLSLLDNLSGGRLDAGFGRAFLPTEFDAFGIAMEESRGRLVEGVEAVTRLWSEHGFRFEGPFHRFGPLPELLPRTAQRPHPPVFIAATTAPETFTWAGREGHHLMVIPSVVGHDRLALLLDAYRQARREAGHTTPGRLHLSVHAHLDEDRARALDSAEQHYEEYRAYQLDAYASWRGTTSDAYPGYEKMEEAARAVRFEDLLEAGHLIAGDPSDAVDALRATAVRYPGAEISLHLRYGEITHREAQRSLRLLGAKVLPELAELP